MPFGQVGDNRSRTEGVGLGLTICRQLADIMGGMIYVESELGKGSCFGFDGVFTHVDGFDVTEIEKKTAAYGLHWPTANSIDC